MIVDDKSVNGFYHFVTNIIVNDSSIRELSVIFSLPVTIL